MDNRLLRLKVDIDEKQPIIQLKNDIAAFAGKLELNAAGEKIKNNTNYKAIIKKNNVYNIPDRLKKYSPIISDDQICINWIDWKSRGETFDTKGICPYCSDELNAGFAEEKQTFKETYKKSDAQNLKNMLDLFENFHKYIPDDKFDSIIACIKEEKEESAISAILKTFMNEYVHISTQLNKISYFDKNVFKKININDIDKVLEDMKFEKSIFNFFSSDGFYEIVDEVNNSIEELRKEAIDIKVAKVSGFSSQVVDTTGAGDSFWGGFMSQFVKSKLNPEDCSMEELKKFARYGNAVASLCIEKKGGILSIPEEKETFKRLQLSV